jgi:hypothetical protein
MSFTKMLTVFLVFSSSVALAAPPLLTPVAQCPAIGEEFEAMLAKLDNIKTSVREGANCANVALKVQSLQDLLTTERAKILQIVEQGRSQALTLEQSEQVRNYAEEITKKIAALNDLFTGSNRCFRDDNADAGLASLSTFVSEAAGLVSSVAGPWGTPIALAGNVVAGFLTGLDKIIKTRAGYDYSKPENWKNYVQNLCTFHSYRDQIEHLLNPQARISQLQGLKTQLEAQIATMSSRCEECQTIERTFATQSMNSPEVQRANQRFSQPFGTFMLYSVGIRNWVTGEIARVQRESASFWADVSGRHVLSQARADLEQFLVNRESPRFLNWQVGQASRDFGTFQGHALQEGRALYGQLQALNPAILTTSVRGYFTNPVDMFKALIVSPLKWELVPAQQSAEVRDSWTTYRDRGLSRLRDSEMSLQVVQGFCSFYRQAGYYSSQVKQVCTGQGVREVANQINDLNGHLARVNIQPAFQINPQIFDPNFSGARSPRTVLESLQRSVEQLKPN